MSQIGDITQIQSQLSSHDNDIMDTTTILLIFLMAFLNTVFQISLLVVIIRKIKQIFQIRTFPYYYMVILYIIGKLIALGFLQSQIIADIPNEFRNIKSEHIQKYFKITIIIADLSLVQMFMASFQAYMMLCFKILTMDKFKKIFKIAMYTVEIIIFIIEVVGLLLFLLDQLGYDVINTINAFFNFLSIVSFLVSFFYLNFKMTGLMIDTQLNSTMKSIYGIILALLLSRFLMTGFQMLILVEINDGIFMGFINTIQQNQGQYITYGLCFICYFVFILITEGVPMMMSLRAHIIRAFNQKVKQQQEQNSRQNINQHLLDSSSQIDARDQIELIVEFKAFKILESFPSTTTMWNTMKASIGERIYILRQIQGEVSNYIIEDIINEIEEVKQLNIKPLNKVGFFTEQGYRPIDFDQMMERCKTLVDQLKLALKIALAIQKFHFKQIAHGCIKPNNINFDLSDNVYFLGYGLQTLKKYFSLTTDYTNKSFCTAIQLLKDRNAIVLRPKKSADIYSFGMILYEIVTKNKDYREMQLEELRKKFGQEHFRPKIPDSVEGNVKNLMRKCWEIDPFQRPYIGYVIDVLKRLIH